MKRLLSQLRHLSSASQAILGVAVGIALVVFLLDLRVRAQRLRGSFPDEADKYYLPPPDTLRITSMGYREAAADLVWIAAIQHAADRRYVGGERFPWLEQYVDAVLALNPFLLKVYLWTDGTLTYARGRLRNRDWRRAIHYLERGHRAFPRNWELLFKLACAYTELRTKSRARRSRNMRIAADYLWKAHMVGGGPAWLPSLAARYWSEEGQWMLAYRRALEEFKSTELRSVRQEMGDRLAEMLSRSAGGMSLVEHFARLGVPTAGNPAVLGAFLVGEVLQTERVLSESKQQVQEVARQKDRFDRSWQRCLPYGSSDLFSVLGACDRSGDATSTRDVD
ncbi:MAG: hypothetical protein ABI333_07600 [bacterium]